MDSGIIIILLIAIVFMLAVGFYLIFTSGRTSSGIGADSGIHIIGNDKSIVSVRKVGRSGDYIVKVEEAPVLDMYEAGEFLPYIENPLDRWMRTDLPEEERRRLSEELRTMYGINMRPESRPVASESADKGSVTETDAVGDETEDSAGWDVFNEFEGYDPFAPDTDKKEVPAVQEKDSNDGHDDKVALLMEFIRDSFRKGLVSRELVEYACKRYGYPEGEGGLERFIRENPNPLPAPSVSDMDLMSMSDDEFESYVRGEVAEAAVTMVADDRADGRDDAGKADNGLSDTKELEAADEISAATTGYSWDHLDESI